MGGIKLVNSQETIITLGKSRFPIKVLSIHLLMFAERKTEKLKIRFYLFCLFLTTGNLCWAPPIQPP